jgi:hypothetical protein
MAWIMQGIKHAKSIGMDNARHKTCQKYFYLFFLLKAVKGGFLRIKPKLESEHT